MTFPVTYQPCKDTSNRLFTESKGSGPRLVLVHGFTQTSRLWGKFGDLLAAQRQTISVDLPGHGSDQSASIRADIQGCARILIETIGDLIAPDASLVDGTSFVDDASDKYYNGDGSDNHAFEFDLLGYSLGARVALQTALMYPKNIRRLILISGTPGIIDQDQRSIRKDRDNELATRLEESKDTEGFLRGWLSSPMFSRLSVEEANLKERLRNSADGLASSLRLAGTGTQVPLWDLLAQLEVPTLLVTGMTDIKFTSIANNMTVATSKCTLSVVPGAGHAVHLEQPERCATIVEHWFTSNAHLDAKADTRRQ